MTPPTSLFNPIARNGSICTTTPICKHLKKVFSFNFINWDEYPSPSSPTSRSGQTLATSSARNSQYFPPKYCKFFVRIPPKTSPRFRPKQKLAFDTTFFKFGGGFSVEMCLCRPPSPFHSPQIIFIFYRIVEYYVLLCYIY